MAERGSETRGPLLATRRTPHSAPHRSPRTERSSEPPPPTLGQAALQHLHPAGVNAAGSSQRVLHKGGLGQGQASHKAEGSAHLPPLRELEKENSV